MFRPRSSHHSPNVLSPSFKSGRVLTTRQLESLLCLEAPVQAKLLLCTYSPRAVRCDVRTLALSSRISLFVKERLGKCRRWLSCLMLGPLKSGSLRISRISEPGSLYRDVHNLAVFRHCAEHPVAQRLKYLDLLVKQLFKDKAPSTALSYRPTWPREVQISWH